MSSDLWPAGPRRLGSIGQYPSLGGDDDGPTRATGFCHAAAVPDDEQPTGLENTAREIAAIRVPALDPAVIQAISRAGTSDPYTRDGVDLRTLRDTPTREEMALQDQTAAIVAASKPSWRRDITLLALGAVFGAIAAAITAAIIG